MIDLTVEQPLKVNEVAEMFRVHRRTVEGWFNAGLERVNLCGSVFTTKQALQRFAVPSSAGAYVPARKRSTVRNERVARQLEVILG